MVQNGYSACDGADLVLSSRTKSDINSVIHQKNKLKTNQPRKLWPFCCATDAGQRAIVIHKNRMNAVQRTEKVNPRTLNTIRTPLLMHIVYISYHGLGGVSPLGGGIRFARLIWRDIALLCSAPPFTKGRKQAFAFLCSLRRTPELFYCRKTSGVQTTLAKIKTTARVVHILARLYRDVRTEFEQNIWQLLSAGRPRPDPPKISFLTYSRKMGSEKAVINNKK